MSKRVLFVGTVVCLAAWSGHGASQELSRFEEFRAAMGTTFRIVLYLEDQATATRAMDAAFARIRQLDETLSDYSDASELTKLCDRAGSGPVTVSQDLFDVLSHSSNLSTQTNGAFDVTAGPIFRLWRKARRNKHLPSDPLLEEARSKSGYDKMRLDASRRTVDLTMPGMKLDLGGVAKGFACDEAMKTLRSHGIERAMVVGGGDIVVGASPPGQPGWKIAIGPELKPEIDDPPILVLKNQAVSTSGDSSQFVMIRNRRYSHIVDPRTGIAISERLRVTVVAPTGMQSDSYATAVSVLGIDKGVAWIDERPRAAALIARVGSVVELHPSQRWQEAINGVLGQDGLKNRAPQDKL